MKVLKALPDQQSENLLIGGGPDDAGVYRIDEHRVMLQSVDFFTPIVDEPSDYGRIAAANSMSDIYAMGGRPETALNVVGVPLQEVGIERLQSILSAGQETVNRAGAVVVGGHTVKTPEPLFGMAVTGFAEEKVFRRNGQGRPGDSLILTKPLGTGIITTAHKQQQADDAQLREAVHWMTTLNEVGADLAESNLISCMTDITGYGFLGHLLEMLGESMGARISYSSVPVIEGVLDMAREGFVPGGTHDNWQSVKTNVDARKLDEHQRLVLADAQTSGGLLIACDPEDRETVRRILRENELEDAVVGTITEERQVVVVA